MSHPQYDAEKLITEHGVEDALLHARDTVSLYKPTTPEHFHSQAVWCYIKGYCKGMNPDKISEAQAELKRLQQ